LGFTVLGLASLTGAVYGWYTHRPQPNNLHEELYKGVTYERISFKKPRPMVVHIVTVDLKKSHVQFFTTPPVEGLKYPYKAQAVSAFLKQNKLQLAINADFFKPYWGRGPWDYYPHFGDPVYSRGLSIHEGKIITPVESHRPSIYFSKEGAVSFKPPEFVPFDAISGESVFLSDGKWAIKEPDKSHWRGSIQPRCSIGLSQDKKKFLMIVIDGRQPGYSEGATVHEMADIAVSHGAGTMLDLDGGGSETLVQEGKDGEPYLLNCPIDSWIPNRERPVATQLGLRLLPQSND
jgi:hypothetical protein